ncbi:ABC transporter permease [Luteimonas pelagia]
MNASIETVAAPRHPAATPHPTHKLKLLLRREFWEHKGGFLWTPLVAGVIFLALSLMGIVTAEFFARKAIAEGEMAIDGEVVINGLDLGMLTERMDAGDLVQLGKAIDASLFMASTWPLIVLAFVVFFYCLGALYDERKDRSVLFWKSLPVSDRDTVLSKAASALVVAPVLAIAAALATMVGFLVLVSLVALLHGGNPFTLLWGPASPLSVAGSLLLAIPVYALWALPTVGWLLLCSAWAKSKPFLWAIMLPVFAGIFVSWFDLMRNFELGSDWFWANVVGRLLLGTVPGSHIPYRDAAAHVSDPDDVFQLLNPAYTLENYAMPELWIGAVFGAAFIYGAIRLRRWRDDA